MNKPITEQMSEVTSLAEELKNMLERRVVANKIWVEDLGVVTLWETQK